MPVSFAYARATYGAEGKDEQFNRNREEIGAKEIWRGAYHHFDFCASVEDQTINVEQTVRVDPSTLPLAVDLVSTTISIRIRITRKRGRDSASTKSD